MTAHEGEAHRGNGGAMGGAGPAGVGGDDAWMGVDAWADFTPASAPADPGPGSSAPNRGIRRTGSGRRVRPRSRLPGWTRRPPASAPPPESAAAPAPPALRYPTVEEFVTRLLFPTYQRNLRRESVSWCPRWWAHAEAITRLDALWRAFEHLRLDPALGGARWWLTYADPTMKALLAEDGPFAACRYDRHTAIGGLGPLPADPAPAGLFTTPPDLRPRRPSPPEPLEPAGSCGVPRPGSSSSASPAGSSV